MNPQNVLHSKSEVLSVCRLCLKVCTVEFYPLKQLDICLFSFFPNLDFSLSKDPGVCINCMTILIDSYNFRNVCLKNQEKILKYYQALNRPVDLYNLVKDHVDKENMETSYSFVEEPLDSDIKADLCDISEYSNSALKQNKLSCDSTHRGDEEKQSMTEFEVESDINYCDLKKNDSQCFYNDDDNIWDFEVKNSIDSIIENENFGHNDNSENSIKYVDINQVVFNYTPNFESQEATDEQELNIDNDSIQLCKEEVKPGKASNNQHTFWKKLNSRVYQCLLCQKKFVQKIHLDSHLLNKHKDISKITDAIESKIHYCSHCDYCTINTYNLTSHLLSKHGKIRECRHQLKKLCCSFCNYTTRNKGNLDIHMRIHRKVKMFNCTYCEKSFNQKSSLNAHYINRHKEEIQETSANNLVTGKVYVCNVCQLKTLDKSKHYKHVKKHLSTGKDLKNIKLVSN